MLLKKEFGCKYLRHRASHWWGCVLYTARPDVAACQTQQTQPLTFTHGPHLRVAIKDQVTELKIAAPTPPFPLLTHSTFKFGAVSLDRCSFQHDPADWQYIWVIEGCCQSTKSFTWKRDCMTLVHLKEFDEGIVSSLKVATCYPLSFSKAKESE